MSGLEIASYKEIEEYRGQSELISCLVYIARSFLGESFMSLIKEQLYNGEPYNECLPYNEALL